MMTAVWLFEPRSRVGGFRVRLEAPDGHSLMMINYSLRASAVLMS